MPVTLDDLRLLLDSWLLHLRAERKSAETLKDYGTGARQFLDWLAETDTESALTRSAVNAFVNDLFERDVEATTARARQLAVRRFSAWLAEEGEIVRDELVGLKPPKLDQKGVPELTDEQVKALIKACKGNRMMDRRDEAIVRFMVETAARSGEVVAMQVPDVA